MEKNSPCPRKSAASSHLPFVQWQDLFSVLELFTIPLAVFSADGMSLFVNQAFQDFFRIDRDSIIGKLNILEDPYINRKLGLTDYLRCIFAGEILSVYDIRVPFEEIGRLYQPAKGRPVEHTIFQDIYQDIICFPVWKEDQTVSCVIALFMTSRVYQVRLDVIKAREYMDAHWLDDFDLDRIARAASMSRDHMARIFKKFMGMTPYNYYQELKIEKIKEALHDPDLSVSEAFASCGADYSGGLREAFKRKVGMTPTQYRKAWKAGSPETRTHAGDMEKQSGDTGHFPMASPSLFHETENKLFQIAGLFPIPIQIFKPNGDIVFINEAVLKMWNVRDATIIGKYNLLKDVFVNEQFGVRDYVERAFRGEIVLIPDIRIPLESFWECQKTRSAVYDIEAIYNDILNFPVWDVDGQMVYMVSIFFISRIYQGRADVAKAREYIENHWRETFDIHRLAEAVGLSSSHLSRLFKKHVGITPYSYYQEFKVNRLKAALRDQNLSIAEAFVSCGFENHGNYARFFKKKVGMTPSQYRKSVRK